MNLLLIAVWFDTAPIKYKYIIIKLSSGEFFIFREKKITLDSHKN